MVKFKMPHTISYFSSIATVSILHRFRYIISDFLEFKKSRGIHPLRVM